MWSQLKAPKITPSIRSKLAIIEHLKRDVLSAYSEQELEGYYKSLTENHILSSLLIEGDDTSKSSIFYQNLSQAANCVQKDVKENIKFDEVELLKLHGILGKNILNSCQSGQYRRVRNMISSFYETAQINQISKLMAHLFDISNSIENPVVRAGWFSYNLVAIHPFVDFNGRLSRLTEMYILMESSLPTVYIPQQQIPTYFKLMKSGQEIADPVNLPYIDFLCNLLIETLSFIWNGNTI